MKKEQYLAEDKDILNKLESLRPGLSEEILSELQIKSSLRNRKSIEELNKTTDLYSKVLIFLTIILLVVSLFQLIASIIGIYKTSQEQLGVLIFVLVSIMVITWVSFKKFFK